MSSGGRARECSSNWCDVDDYNQPECFARAMGNWHHPLDELDRDCDAIVERIDPAEPNHRRCGCGGPPRASSGLGP